MANYKIKCEVVKVDDAHCQKVGDSFTIWKRTPDNMCCGAFNAVYAVSLAMRFSDKMAWETPEGYFEIMCPDKKVRYRLSRIKEDAAT